MVWCSEIAWALWQPLDLVSALLVRCLAPLFRGARVSRRYPWVMGGHRGRLRADNAGDLHRYLLSQTQQASVWIANAPLARQLRAQGIAAIDRNTWKARMAILRAPVLIYSHGEDDLDQYALLWRKKLGFRVHLNHSMNFLKAGQWYRKDVDSMGWLRRKVFGFLMVDFDALLACSELERQNFRLSFPHLTTQIHLGGGAHIDTVLARRQIATSRRILWFPTFRDTRLEAEQLSRIVAEVTQSTLLQEWLRSEEYTLVICHHINSTPHAQSAHSIPCIEWVSPAQLDLELGRCCAFISDYSGILIDWLALGRPTLFFPFDLDSYQRTRRFYVHYPEWHFGPMAQTPQEMIELLRSNTWRDLQQWETRRRSFLHQAFPSQEPEYAKHGYMEICKLARVPVAFLN